MFKRSLCLLLLLLPVVFSGCNLQMTMLPQTTKPSIMKPTEAPEVTEPTEPAETVKPTESPRPSKPVYLEQPKEDPVRPDTMPADVPNIINGIYFTCGNYYYTLYLDPDYSGESIMFYLITENPLPGDAKIVTNLQTEHRIYLRDETPKNINTIAQYLKRTALGLDIDWEKLYQTERKIYENELDYLAGNMTWDEYTNTYRVLLNEKNSISGDDGSYPLDTHLPVNFCYYSVQILITKYQVSEELTSVELVAGDMSCTIPIGEIRLRKRVNPETAELNSKVLARGRDLAATSLPMYGNIPPTVGEDPLVLAKGNMSGYRQTVKCFFFAKEDITLTDANFFANGGENCRIIGADVVLTPTDGNKATGDLIHLQWTPGTPLQIRESEMVEIYVHYEDPWYQMVEYAAKHYMVFEYRCGTETGRILGTSAETTREWLKIGELYLWALTDKKADVEGYYNQYFWPIQKYLKEIGGEPMFSNPNNPPMVIP